MILGSIVLCNKLFKKKQKNKRVGFVLEHWVSMEKQASFFSLFVYSSFYHQILHLFMIKTSLKHHKRRKTLSLAKIHIEFKKISLQIKENVNLQM